MPSSCRILTTLFVLRDCIYSSVTEGRVMAARSTLGATAAVRVFIAIFMGVFFFLAFHMMETVLNLGERLA